MNILLLSFRGSSSLGQSSDWNKSGEAMEEITAYHVLWVKYQALDSQLYIPNLKLVRHLPTLSD